MKQQEKYNPLSARSKRPFPLWADAFHRDTQHLSADEIGAYMLILIAMWSRKSCDFPDNERQLAQVSRVSTRLWRSRVGVNIMPLFKVVDGVVKSKKLREEATYAERHVTRQHCNKTGEDPYNLLKSIDRHATTVKPRTKPRKQPTQLPNNPTKESSSIPIVSSGESEAAKNAVTVDDDFSSLKIMKEAGMNIVVDPHIQHFWDRGEHTDRILEWHNEHGLSRSVIVDAIRRVLERHNNADQPIKSMRFFHDEMMKSKNKNGYSKLKPKVDKAAFWAEHINAGKFVSAMTVKPNIVREMIGRELVTAAQAKAAGLAF